MLDALAKLLRPIETKLANLVARGVVRRVDDGAKLQLLQLLVLDTEVRERLERCQEYGLTSVPLEGAEAVVLFPGGHRGHGLVVAVVDRRYRPTGLAPGEVALYHHEGDRLTFLNGGRARLTSGDLELGEGGMQPAVRGTALRTELDAIWTALGAHVHAGVTTGGGTSGPATVTPATQPITSTSVKVGS